MLKNVKSSTLVLFHLVIRVFLNYERVKDDDKQGSKGLVQVLLNGPTRREIGQDLFL